MPNWISCPYHLDKNLDENIFEFKGWWMVNFNFIRILKVHLCANSAKPDQMPQSAASDLVFHCLPMSHKKEAGLKWVKGIIRIEIHIFNLWFRANLSFLSTQKYWIFVITFLNAHSSVWFSCLVAILDAWFMHCIHVIIYTYIFLGIFCLSLY